MEERKLIRLGNSSFAISLPKEWIGKSGLKKGDKVFIMPNSNGEIIVAPEFKKDVDKESRIIVDNKGLEEIKREFISAYINGNSIFKFEGEINKGKRKFIKKIIRNFISCEANEETEKLISVKDFFDFEEIDIDNFTKRACSNVEEMFSNLIGSIKRKKITSIDLNNIKEIDSDINKIYFLNSRLMNLGLCNSALANSLEANPESLFNNWWLTFNLEHIGDGIKSISKILKGNMEYIKNYEKYVSIIGNVRKIYNNTLKAFYDKDKNKAQQIMNEGKIFWDKCEKLINKKDQTLSLVAERLKNIENTCYQIVKIILNLKT